MKGITRSIVGSIIIILIIIGIVVFTDEDEEVGNTAIQNQTQDKPMRKQMPTDNQTDDQANVEEIQQVPPEALEACKDLKEGDKCTFMSDNEICLYVQDQLACVPDRFN